MSIPANIWGPHTWGLLRSSPYSSFRNEIDIVVDCASTDRLEKFQSRLQSLKRNFVDVKPKHEIAMIEASLFNSDVRVVEFLLDRSLEWVIGGASASSIVAPGSDSKGEHNPRAVTALLKRQSQNGCIDTFAPKLLELYTSSVSPISSTDRPKFKRIFFEQLILGGIDRKELECRIDMSTQQCNLSAPNRRKVRRALKMCDRIRTTLEDKLPKVLVDLVYEYLV